MRQRGNNLSTVAPNRSGIKPDSKDKNQIAANTQDRGERKSNPVLSFLNRKVTRGSPITYNRQTSPKMAKIHGKRGSTLSQNRDLQRLQVSVSAKDYERMTGVSKTEDKKVRYAARTVVANKFAGGPNYSQVIMHMRYKTPQEFAALHGGITPEEAKRRMSAGHPIPDAKKKNTLSFRRLRRESLEEQIYVHGVFHRDGKTLNKSWKLEGHVIDKKKKWPNTMKMKMAAFKSPEYAEMKKSGWTGASLRASIKPGEQMSDEDHVKHKQTMKSKPKPKGKK